jgi:hypothetical protein
LNDEHRGDAACAAIEAASPRVALKPKFDIDDYIH